jgi:hypothetical protein
LSTRSATGKAPRPGEGPILLLVPDPSKPDSHLLRGDGYVCEIAGDLQVLKVLASPVFQDPRHSHKHFKYQALVKHGLFYSVDAAGVGQVMPVIPGRELRYVGAKGSIANLGAVVFRGQIDVNRFLTRDEFARLERMLEQWLTKAAATVADVRRDRALKKATLSRPAEQRPQASVPSVRKIWLR